MLGEWRTFESPKSIEIPVFTGLRFVDPTRIAKNGSILLVVQVQGNKGMEIVDLCG